MLSAIGTSVLLAKFLPTTDLWRVVAGVLSAIGIISVLTVYDSVGLGLRRGFG